MSYLITQGRYAGLIAKENNQRLVTTTGPAATDQIHLIPVGRSRSFYVTKLMWYNTTGGNILLVLGTLSNAVPAAMVQFFPTLLAIAGIPGGLNEEDLVGIEFMLNSQATPNGWDGSFYVTSSVAGVEMRCEVAEKL